MKANDIRGMSVEELKRKTSETLEELFQTRLQNITGALENTAKIRTLRKNVARIKTILTQKEAKR